MPKSFKMSKHPIILQFEMQQNNLIDLSSIFIINKRKDHILHLQNNAIQHIQQLNLEIQNIMHQIQQQSPCNDMSQSPNGRKLGQPLKNSHVKRKLYDQSNTAHQKYKDKALASKKPSTKALGQNNSTTTIHFTGYMKSTGNVSERLIQQLKKENELKQIEKERQIQRLKMVKQKANKHYNQVKSRYAEYEDQKKMKQVLETFYIKQKQIKEMDDLTFVPKTNKNIEINETFQERLKDSSVRRELKEAKIIKQMIKNETFHPKINSHILSQSKVKMHWSRINHTQVKETIEFDINENELKVDAEQFKLIFEKNI